MSKLTTNFVIRQYQSGIENYSNFTTEVGLWASEAYVFTKYLKKKDKILDVGCGTGRTTFHLFKKGYEQIEGLDLTPEMIVEAKALNKHFQLEVPFQVGDARKLEQESDVFDAVIFSFNGLMSIPASIERNKAIAEINRVLKQGGLFLFTTHDREKDENYFDFWKEQQQLWQKGEQNPQLYEFGDLITTSKNEERDIYIHIPNQAEVRHLLEQRGFEVVETFYRSDEFDENEAVKKKSGECRFWVAKRL